jgi:hypothetical protein
MSESFILNRRQDMTTFFDKLKNRMSQWFQRPLGDTALTDSKDKERNEPFSSFREGKKVGKDHPGRGDKRPVNLPNQTIYRGGPPHHESFSHAPHKAMMFSKGQRTKNP